MAESDKTMSEQAGRDGHARQYQPDFDVSRTPLEDEKEHVGSTQGWTEIKTKDAGPASRSLKMQPAEARTPDSSSNSQVNGVRISSDTAQEIQPVPMEPEEQSESAARQPSTLRSASGISATSTAVPSTSTEIRSNPYSTVTSNGTHRNTTLSSMVFVITALESIASSKEARKRKQLSETVQRALGAIKQLEPEFPDPEVIFEPLQLATLVNSIPLATIALDCIGKLISYSYFAVPTALPAPQPGTGESQTPLIERAIDTICDCFQGEATAVEIQLQIVKSLLAAVLNDKIVVHGAGLLKAVRQTYNIFLLSKSSANQQVAQGTLTQMVGTVFERVKSRISMKEARMNLTKLRPGKVGGSGSESALDTISIAVSTDETSIEESQDDFSEAASTATSDHSGRKEPREKITLQSFENQKTFDDNAINDNAPTMVTRLKPNQIPSRLHESSAERDHAVEDEEDEIYIKDAFLVFRAMCKLSIKTLSPDQLVDLKSHGMRSKLLSLHLIHTILHNNMLVFTSPASTIRSNSSSEPTSFVQAVKQYLCLSLSRNGASSVNRVFEVGCEIFWLMLKNLRVMLKKEIEVFLKEIYLAILDKRNAPISQKQYLMGVLERLSADPRALVEIYLNYDCDRTALDNMFQRIIEQLSRISSTSVPITAVQQQQYEDQQLRSSNSTTGWRNRSTLPPSLSTASIGGAADSESSFPVEYSLKRQALECLVETLRSLVNWSQDGIADASARLQDSASRNSVEEFRESLDVPNIATNVSSPKLSNVETHSSIPSPMMQADDDPNQLEKEKQRKTALMNGIKQFNFKPKRGIKFLLKEGFIPSDMPDDIAAFLLENDRLDKAMIGEYLGEGEPENIEIMHAFVDLMDFSRTRFVDALRRFLQSFRLPGEAQKIDRFMLKFAERYITGNPNAFANADTAYVLAYSVIMLNTDQHSVKLKGNRMTKEDFIKNNRGINDSADLPDDYLSGIFEEIAHNEIVLLTERDAAASLGVTENPAGGLANMGFLANVGRDLRREAYVQASEEMAQKTEQLFRSLVRSQRKTMEKTSLARFIPATSFKHVGPMFDVTWMSFLSGLSGQVQDTQNLETIKLCMEGLQLAIRIACLFDLETPRVAFVSALAKFTNLNNLSEMVAKNVEALKILLEVALTEGDLLKSSWLDVLTCISQLDRFQLISTGIDEGVVPDVSRAKIVHPRASESSGGRASSMQSIRRPRPKSANARENYLPGVAQESRSAEIIKSVDKIFSTSGNLSGDAIVHFVRALSEVSWQEIQSSGQSESPRTYSLQKLVEISYYNMGRVRFEWTNIWLVLGEHFNHVGCHTNTNVVYIALDSLRQLSMRFMEIEELPGFKFQKDFLKPFEHVMANSSVVAVKDMVLQCLIQMIKLCGHNIRSGWRTMFAVFTVAAKEPYEGIVKLAYENVTQIYDTRFGVVISQGAFADMIVCLTEFAKNMKFQRIALQAIETLKSTIPKMLKTPECPLSNITSSSVDGSKQNKTKAQRQVFRTTQEEQYWFPVLFAFHNILMTGDDLEARSRALGYLFDILRKYGGDFPRDFWDMLWRQILYPIFVVLKSRSEMSRAPNLEELSVWLSTTMIQALRNMITLFTHYFDSLEYMLDQFLELLTLCICQENDTIARIGSNCLQQLVLQNVEKFDADHWAKIVSAFVKLFDKTTARKLFSATSSSSSSSSAELSNGQPLKSPGPSSMTTDLAITSTPTQESSDGLTEENSLRINGLPPPRSSVVVSDAPETPPPMPDSAGMGELEDYRPPSEPQTQPVVVTAVRRKFFNEIITKCVLQLLMIETVNELFSNERVYQQIPSGELLRLMGLLKHSYQFAKKFNGNKDLRMRLWREGFMKQPPNLLKQESGSAATYVNILLRMYHDESEEKRSNRADIEAALIPLCADIIRSYNLLDEDTQQRNISAWRPVVVDVIEGYTNFPVEGFEKHVNTFYPLAVGLLGRDVAPEIRIALQGLLRRVGEVHMGMPLTPATVSSPTNSLASPSINGRRRGSRGF